MQVSAVFSPLDSTNLQYSFQGQASFHTGFNKTDSDMQPHDFAVEWMSDFEEFQAALTSHSGTPGRDSEGEPTYMNSLMNSMSLVLDEFIKISRYSTLFCFCFLK
jgi:hypothetical protein